MLTEASVVSDTAPRVRRAKSLRSRAKLRLPTFTVVDVEVDRVALNGISLFVPNKLPEAESCAVQMSLFVEGCARELRAKGTVVSCSLSGMNGFRVAVRFTDIDQDSAIVLEKWLR